ncbi:MAG: LytTR family transcriptional regulator DNA-binding domain-containing protein [Tenacibaculum sp.]|nr:LytTR family transcriptional regulator DNA-binding domain-containing protein [Tenacibaculum sp.]
MFLLQFFVIGAQNYTYENYTTSDGLSSSEVYDITQDKNGYIWFATDRGLTQYDGYEFKRYSTKDGLEDLVILNFQEQEDGTILCVTFNGKLFFIDPNTNDFYPYKYNHLLKDISTTNNILSAIKHKNYLIVNYRYQYGGFLKIYDNGKVEKKIFNCQDDTEIKVTYNYQLLKEILNTKNNGSFLKEIARKFLNDCNIKIKKINENYFLIVQQENFYLINCREKKYQLITNKRIVATTNTFDDNHFWVGLNYGGGKVFSYDGKLKYHFLPNNTVTKFFKDHEGGLWLGTTESGVFYIKNPGVITHKTPSTCKDILSLSKNNKNELYIGFDNGELYKIKQHKFKKIWEFNHNTPARVQYNSKTDRLFVQSDHLYELKNDKIDTLYAEGYSVALSDNQNKNLLTKNRVFYKNGDSYIIPPSNRRQQRIGDIEFADEGYYLGTLLGLYQYKQDSLYNLRSITPLFDSRIDDIDKIDNRYFFASLGNGVVIKNKDSIYSINTTHGLSSNITTQIYAKNPHEIYVATNNGLNKISFSNNLKTYNISHFSTKDGLPGNQINDIEIINDSLWIATKNGLHSFSESLLDNKNKNMIKDWLQIKKILINNKTTFNNLENLRHFENSVEYKFSAISYKKEDRILYRYRLLGLESEWNITENRSVKYPDLLPGKYTFELQTKGGNDSWNTDGICSTIIIAYPFWETWWFYSGMTFLILLIIYSFFKFKILLYNEDVFRELMLFVLKKITGKKEYVIIRESGVEIKLDTSKIYFAKSAGNYLEIVTTEKTYVVRLKIGDFEKQLPDDENFLRVHRSYLIRKDKIEKKNTKWVQINGEEIPVSRNNKSKLEDVLFY